MWINIPISASTGCMPIPQGDSCWTTDSSSYVSQLAKLLKEQLPENAAIYVEHSNEVWNFGFSQYIYNKLNAVDVCTKTGNKNLICSVPCPKQSAPNDTSPCADQSILARRRHMQRVYEIVQEFAEVFGQDQINQRIRGIFAEWTIYP